MDGSRVLLVLSRTEEFMLMKGSVGIPRHRIGKDGLTDERSAGVTASGRVSEIS